MPASQDDRDPSELRAAYGEGSVSVRGPVAVIVLCVLGVIVSQLYIGHRTERTVDGGVERLVSIITGEIGRRRVEDDRRQAEHMRIIDDNRVLACILSLSPADRDAIRKQYSVSWELVCPGLTRRP